jgi:hypothetical protein
MPSSGEHLPRKSQHAETAFIVAASLAALFTHQPPLTLSGECCANTKAPPSNGEALRRS